MLTRASKPPYQNHSHLKQQPVCQSDGTETEVSLDIGVHC